MEWALKNLQMKVDETSEQEIEDSKRDLSEEKLGKDIAAFETTQQLLDGKVAFLRESGLQSDSLNKEIADLEAQKDKERAQLEINVRSLENIKKLDEKVNNLIATQWENKEFQTPISHKKEERREFAYVVIVEMLNKTQFPVLFPKDKLVADWKVTSSYFVGPSNFISDGFSTNTKITMSSENKPGAAYDNFCNCSTLRFVYAPKMPYRDIYMAELNFLKSKPLLSNNSRCHDSPKDKPANFDSVMTTVACLTGSAPADLHVILGK